MPWQVAIAISILTGIATILIQRRYAQRSKAPATFPSAFSYLFGVLPVGLLAGTFIFPHRIYWSRWLVFLLLIEGVAMAISGWTGFKAAARMAIAPRQTIGTVSTVATVVLGWTLLHEGLTTFQVIGAATLLAASILAAWAPLRRGTTEQKKAHLDAVLLTVAASLSLSVALTTEKGILGHMQIGGIFLVGWVAQAAAMVLLALKDTSRTNLRSFRSYEMRWSIIFGLANGFTGVFYVYAIVHSDNISLISSLGAVSLPLTALGAYLFLHERENRKLLWMSLGLSSLGLLVIALH